AVDSAVEMQLESPIGRRPRVDGEAFAHRHELRSGRWGGEQAHLTALAVVYLMHVAPGDRADVAVRIDDAPEFVGVGETYAVEPAAVHADRVMMQTYHGGGGRICQCAVEAFEILRRQTPPDVARVIAVQHYKLPAALQVGAANLKRRIREFPAHGFRFVMISRNAKHRLLQIAEDAANPQIAGRVGLDDIPGH